MNKAGELDLALHDRLDGLNLEDLQDSAGIKWRRYGRDVLPAWVAEMDFPVAPPIREALGRLVSRSQLGYHNVPISTRLRRALVQRLAERFGWTVAPEQVRPLVNVVQGLEAAVFSCTRPGEGVLVQTPI
ncbi:MAG: aminotransferase, partial [Myxococcota bacterium]|nr:aminotransferase [Myxococcota bacterium]